MMTNLSPGSAAALENGGGGGGRRAASGNRGNDTRSTTSNRAHNVHDRFDAMIASLDNSPHGATAFPQHHHNNAAAAAANDSMMNSALQFGRSSDISLSSSSNTSRDQFLTATALARNNSLSSSSQSTLHHSTLTPRRGTATAPGGGAGEAGKGSPNSPESVHSEQDRSVMSLEEETFYGATDNKHGDDNLWGLLSGVGGNIYEWYDFAVYGLLAHEIGHNFFPKSSARLQLINSFGVYLAAFIMRPLGAVLFGEMGDRLVGRKNALMFSIVLITVPSVAMGLLPTYDKIGAAAPVLLVVLRMFQGLSVGGQLAGSYVISIEQSTAANRGFRGSVCDASSVGGFLLASAVTCIVRWSLDDEVVDDWGWRIPFWFSLVLAPCLYWVVNKTEESKFWEEQNANKEMEQVIRQEEQRDSTPAVMDLLRSPFRRRQLFGVIGTLSVKTSSFYMLFLWTPIYLSSLRGYLSEATADCITFFTVGCYIIFLLICGKLSDRFHHRMDLIRIGLPGVIIACPVMFALFDSESLVGVIIGQLQYAICLSFVQGGMAAWEVEIWMADPTLAFTGVAVGHNLAASLFGGTMPLVATWLFYTSQDVSSGDDDLFSHMIPGYYVAFLGCISLWCISYVVRHPHDVRTGEAKIRKIWKKESKIISWDYGLRQASLSFCDSFGAGLAPTIPAVSGGGRGAYKPPSGVLA